MPDGARQLFDPEYPPALGAPTNPADFDPAVHRDTHPDVLSVGALYDEVETALTRSFPRNRRLWVRGEITKLSEHRSGHLYLDLVDPDEVRATGRRDRGGVPTLAVKCWRSSWAPLRHSLEKEGIELAEGMIVVLRGSLDLYRANGGVSFILAEIDVTALLGRIAAQRAQLLRSLEAEGLLRHNASLPVPEPALHIGLVASPGTEGYHDFVGRLAHSGFGFRISVVKVSVQGAAAPVSIARSLRFLSRSDCDVIVVVRGGGSKADLAAFDTEVVARAVASATKPVFTGIGHTGDESVADIVAARACVTPTECGQQIALSVRNWWESRVRQPSGVLARRIPAFLDEAQTRDTQARGRLTAAARHQLRVHRERIGNKASTLGRSAPARLEACRANAETRAGWLSGRGASHLERAAEQLSGWRRLVAAYNVENQLRRGYSLTMTAEGTLVRSAEELTEGQDIVTRLADGSVSSRVTGSGRDAGGLS
jgi:exodeoxyribonuclease VII large subunit